MVSDMVSGMVPGSPARPRRARTALAAIGFAATLAAAGIGLGSSPASAAPTTEQPAAAAAGWLAGQLVDGERFEADFGPGAVFPDQGLTIDAVLAFAAAGVAADHAAAALAWLATPQVRDNYLGYEFGGVFAGAHAKLALAALVWGLDPASVGGLDVIAQLRATENGEGRFADESDFGDFSNAFSQSFAILALHRTGDGAPASAVGFLLASQCPDGGFPLLFAQETCASDVDATAMAVQALLAVGEDEVAGEGLDWLTGHQQPGGGLGGSPPTVEVNANSTGLAAQALWAGSRDAAAEQAVAYLRSLQGGCDAPAERRGAVGYDDSEFDPVTAVRASTQAVLGLAGVGLAELDGTTAQPEAPLLACGEATPSPAPGSPPPVTPTAAPGGQGGGSLPITGSPVLVLVVVGLGLAGAGGIAAWAGRRRRHTGTAAR